MTNKSEKNGGGEGLNIGMEGGGGYVKFDKESKCKKKLNFFRGRGGGGGRRGILTLTMNPNLFF